MRISILIKTIVFLTLLGNIVAFADTTIQVPLKKRSVFGYVWPDNQYYYMNIPRGLKNVLKQFWKSILKIT
jgi:hypothetical protein